MDDLTIFNHLKMPLKINQPIRLIELFAGIGSQAKALQRLGANFEHYRICEFDKYAIKSYNAIHGTNFEISDITKITAEDLGIVDTDKFCYILTYSFPCQDLSLAGKQKLMAKGSGTRSSLLWEVERLLNECTELPQILLMENVTQVHGTKNKAHFDAWITFLESKGYSNYWQDLNAKNFGIPQNRNRTFMVSILGDYTYEFPKEIPLELRLKDILEDSVDEKFYLPDKKMPIIKMNFSESTDQILKVGNINSSQDGLVVSAEGVAPTHTAGHGNTPKIIDPFICASRGRNPENPSDRRAGIPTEQRLEPNFSGCSNTLTTVQKDNYVLEPVIVQKYGDRGTNQYSVRNYAHTIPANPMSDRVQMVVEPTINVVGNYSPSGHDASRIVDGNGLAPTVKENHGTVTAVVEPLAYDEQNGYIRKDGTVGTLTCDGSSPKHNNRVVEKTRIRKLTPKECWRLMGFDDEDFEKAAAENSNTQLYKQAGNSIVVDVLYYIFRGML